MTDSATAAPTDLSSVLRSFIHRPAGDPAEMPDEGRLAPFTGATGWLNSPPLTPDGLRDQVVLVNFWTYTCINWLRTLPYVRAWNEKYGKSGLTIVGVHTPEFDFEHDRENVIEQSRAFDVTWPVALDNNYGVWRAFGNHFWPAIYLADTQGVIRYHHFGESEYAMTEMAIQQLLQAAGRGGIDADLVTPEARGLEVAADYRNLRTGETYLGYGQATGFGSPVELDEDREREYPPVMRLPLGHWAPIGTWKITDRGAVATEPNGRIAFRFQGRDVNLVMGPTERGGRAVHFQVSLDGQRATSAHGTDVDADGHGTVSQQKTYQLIRQPGQIVERTFEIEFLDGGVEALCFTFG
jgi:thiol-disulfide isomerase/thioredoxin